MHLKVLDEVPEYLKRKGKGQEDYKIDLNNYGLSKGKFYKVVETFYNYPSYTCIVINDRHEAKGLDMSQGNIFAKLYHDEDIVKPEKKPAKKTEGKTAK